MIFNVNKSSNTSKNILVVISFVIFAMFNVFIVWHTKILNGFDLYYHLERMMELVRSPEVFPRFNLHTLSDSGTATMTLYPYLWLYPFAILIKLFGNLMLVIYFMFIVSTFVTLMISYYSSIKLGNKKVSYIFALMYALSYEFLDLNFWQSDIGMSQAATFMPLVIFGFIYWLKNNKWEMLSIGLSCVIYSNVPMAFLTIVLMLGWLICNYKKIFKNKYRFINICKCIILTLITTALFWIPALKLYLLNKINATGDPHRTANTADLMSMLSATLNPLSSYTYNGSFYPLELTIYALLGFVVGLICFKHFSNSIKQLYIFATIVIIISTNFFPWNSKLFSHIGGIFQTTVRMFLIPQLIFTYIFSKYVIDHFINRNNKWIKSIIVVIIGILMIQFSYISIFRSQQLNSSESNQGQITSRLLNNPNIHTSPQYYLGDNDMGNTINMTNNNNIMYNNKLIHFIPNNKGGLTFKNSYNIKNLQIPFLYYKGASYKCYVDGKDIKYHSSKDHLISINHINKGSHNIHIIPVLTRTDIIARGLTILSILIYLILIFKKYKGQSIK